MKNKIIASIIFFFSLFFFQGIVLAQEEKNPLDIIPAEKTETNESNSIVIADVNIRDAEIEEAENGKLKINFKVVNFMDIQSDLVYGLELIKRTQDGKVVFSDSQIFYDDKLTIRKDEIIEKEILYNPPVFLLGKFDLFLNIKDQSGLGLATSGFKVDLKGTGKYVEFGNPCYLTIEGDENKYSLIQGVDLRKEEKLFLECQLTNKTKEKWSLGSEIEYYERSFYGDKVSFKSADIQPIEINPEESKLAKIRIPLPEKPQAYDAKVQLFLNGEAFSNPIISHFVVAGSSASIVNMSLDKDVYSKGEAAKLSIILALPADSFTGSRTGGSSLEKAFLELDIVNSDGKVCLENYRYDWSKDGFPFRKELELIMQDDCRYPRVLGKIIEGEEILYEEGISINPPEEKKPVLEEKQAQDNDKKMMPVLTVVVLISLIIILIIFYRKKKKSIAAPLIFLAILFGGFSAAEKTQAATRVLFGDAFLQTSLWSFLTGTDGNWLPIPLTPACKNAVIADSGYPDYLSIPKCNNDSCLAIGNNRPCVVDKPLENISYYCDNSPIRKLGCYRDIVAYSYNLSSTAVNQGTNITASGSITGINACNNGVTAGTVLQPYYGYNNSDARWLVGPINITEDQQSFSGSSIISTSSLPCQSYNAGFHMSFEHGTNQSLTDGSVSKYLFNTIGYSVNNCCTPTCSTGPGCRTSLTNGSVTSGVCCGGTSCYQCNSGYYWNGSYCVASNVTLSGRVTKSNGTAISGARITIANSIGTATTNSSGYWSYTVPSNTIYAARLENSSLPSGYTSYSAVNKRTCYNDSNYEYQRAGKDTYVNCSYTDDRSRDLARDDILDFVVTYPTPVNGSCGTRNTTYSSSTTAWPSGSTYCASGSNPLASGGSNTASTLPAFPASGSTVTWSCQGSNGGSTASCSARRNINNILLSGRVIRDGNTGMPGVTIDIQGYGSVSTNTTGYWSAVLPEGTSYAARVRTSTLPSGYASVTATSNNSCHPSSSGYEYQVAGRNNYISCSYSDARSWDLASDNNLDFNIQYPPPVNGSCGTRNTNYAAAIVAWPRGSTYCTYGVNNQASSNTASTLPAFPSIGATVNWTCSGLNGGSNASCSASRNYYSCGGSIPTNASKYDLEEEQTITSPTLWAYASSDTSTKCQYHCNSGYIWNGSACILPAPVNGSCGTRNTTYGSLITSWPVLSTYCSSGSNPLASGGSNTASTLPAFPSAGSSVSWSCVGLNGGSNASCSASRNYYSCGGSIPANAASYDSEESQAITSPTFWSFSSSDTSTKCQYRCNSGYIWNGSACILPAPVNGSCGTRNTTYASYLTAWPWLSTYCASGSNPLASGGSNTASTLPSFPSAGSTVTWSCQGVDGGVNADCSATRNAYIIISGWLKKDRNEGVGGVTVIVKEIISGKEYSLLTSSLEFNRGFWSISLPEGTLYSVRIVKPYGYDDPPIAKNNNTCYPNSLIYDFQVAGQNRFISCSYPDERGWDLATDDNLDFYFPVDGSCGTRSTIYPATVTEWPSGSTYCSDGANPQADGDNNGASTSPAFPSIGLTVNWTCVGSYGGDDSSCSAGRNDYDCGKLPDNSTPYSDDANFVTDAVNIPWHYSSSDTAEKCEFYCNSGYIWDGSGCIVDSSSPGGFKEVAP